MLKHDPIERISSNQVIQHPFFWKSTQKLLFVHQFGNFIFENKKMRLKFSNFLPSLSTNWNEQIDKRIWEYLNLKSNCNPNKMIDILRALRNIDEHWIEFSKEFYVCDEIFNKKRSLFWKYFDEKFPSLFSLIWEFSIKFEIIPKLEKLSFLSN